MASRSGGGSAGAGAGAAPLSPARYSDKISSNYVHNIVAEYPASLDYARRDELGNIIFSASNRYLFTDNPVLLFAAEQILNNREKLINDSILKYVPTITSTPPPFEVCAFICAANITDIIMRGLNYEGYFRPLDPMVITFLGEVLFIMMYRAFTRFGNINKRFVATVNKLAKREIYKPRTLIFGFSEEDPNVHGLPAGGDKRLPTSAEVKEVINKQFLNRLFMKRDIPGLSGRNKANANGLQKTAAAQEDAAAFDAAESYLTELEDTLAEDMTIKQYFNNDFRRAILTRFSAANYATRYSTYPEEGGTPTARGAAFGFFPPAPVPAAASGGGSSSATAAAPVVAPVAASGGASSSAAAAAPMVAPAATNAGAGAPAVANAPKKEKKEKKAKEGQGGGSRTKKRKYRSASKKSKSQKKSQKSQKSRKSQKTRSRHHR